MGDGYVVHLITCPLCEKQFTAFSHRPNITIDGKDGAWEEFVCPKCETALLVSETGEIVFSEDEAGIYRRLQLD